MHIHTKILINHARNDPSLQSVKTQPLPKRKGLSQQGLCGREGTAWLLISVWDYMGQLPGGTTQSQCGFNLVPAHPHLLRADLAKKPWHLKDEEQVLSWPRILIGTGKDTQGQSWQAIAPCPLLPPTPRTHFPTLAALGPLHPQPCWWVMARTFPSAPGGPLCPLTTGLCPLCATLSPSTALSAGEMS